MDSSFFQALWKLIHFVAFYLPKNRELTKEQLEQFTNFIRYLIIFLPCPGCVDHASMYFIVNHKYLAKCKTGQHVFEWTVDFHNHVNHMYSKREFSYQEAETALLAHLSGYSEQQKKVEAQLTVEQQEIIKLKNQIRILKNETHLPLEEEQAKEHSNIQLTSKNVGFSELTFQCVWDAVHMIAISQPKRQVILQETLDNFKLFLQHLFYVLPNKKLSQDSLDFYKAHEPTFKTQPEIVQFTVDWYNIVSGVAKPVTPAQVEDDLKKRLRLELTSQLQINEARRNALGKIKMLKEEIADLLEKKKKQDAGEKPPPPTFSMSGATLNNLWIVSLVTVSVAVAILLLLIIFFMVLLGRTKTN